MNRGLSLVATEDSLRSALASKGLHVERRDDLLEIRSAGADTTLATIRLEKGARTVHIRTWHGHFDSDEELTWAVLTLLGGYSRVVEEHAGERLTATFRLSYDDEGWFFEDVTYFENPRLREGWQLRDGEVWTWHYTTLHVLDCSREFRSRYPAAHLDNRSLPPGLMVGEEIIARQEPKIWQSDEFFAWFERRFGPPTPHLRWELDRSGRFVYQVPSDWSTDNEAGSDGERIHRSSDSAAEIHTHAMFRETENRNPGFEANRPVIFKSADIYERTTEASGTVWAETVWELYFSNGEEDMAAWFTLRRLADVPESETWLQLKATLYEGLKHAVFTPAH